MILILALFFASLTIIPYLAYISCDKDKGYAIIWGTLSTIATTIIICTIWINSYGSYVDMKKYTANFDIYASAITSYEKFAVLDTKKIKSEITDLKYQNYQRGIKNLIEDLRNSCIKYNTLLAGKRTYGNNIIFNWLIVMPDDDIEIVKFSDFLDVRSR